VTFFVHHYAAFNVSCCGPTWREEVGSRSRVEKQNSRITCS